MLAGGCLLIVHCSLAANCDLWAANCITHCSLLIAQCLLRESALENPRYPRSILIATKQKGKACCKPSTKKKRLPWGKRFFV
jgi:hypothetical protein